MSWAGVMRIQLLLSVIIITSMIPSSSDAHGGLYGEHADGYIIDVLIIDLSCQENNTSQQNNTSQENDISCTGWKPHNLVEYFGSDNCEPCTPVEEQLAQREEDTTFIMTHHPSPSNDFWLQASKARFQDIYLLWGYPSLVIDGHSLLAGKTQAEELDAVISNSSSNYSGFASAELIGNNLTVSHTLENVSIDAWTVSSYSDETRQYTNMAVDHSLVENNSTVVNLDGDHIVIVMSEPGEVYLDSASNSPAIEYIPDGGLEYDETIFEAVDTSTLLILIILLSILILPASMQLIQLMKTEKAAINVSEEE